MIRVNLDLDTLTFPETGQVPEPPKKLREDMLDTLTNLLKPESAHGDMIFIPKRPPGNFGDPYSALSVATHAAFASAVVALLGNFKDFFTPEGPKIFDKDGYAKAQVALSEASSSSFYRAFSTTQSLSCFLHGYTEHSIEFQKALKASVVATPPVSWAGDLYEVPPIHDGLLICRELVDEIVGMALESCPRTHTASWVPDYASGECLRCGKLFSTFNRRHHCRECGALVCSDCSPHKKIINDKPPAQRVCNLCASRGTGKRRSETRRSSRGFLPTELVTEDAVVTPPCSPRVGEFRVQGCFPDMRPELFQRFDSASAEAALMEHARRHLDEKTPTEGRIGFLLFLAHLRSAQGRHAETMHALLSVMALSSYAVEKTILFQAARKMGLADRQELQIVLKTASLAQGNPISPSPSPSPAPSLAPSPSPAPMASPGPVLNSHEYVLQWGNLDPAATERARLEAERLFATVAPGEALPPSERHSRRLGRGWLEPASAQLVLDDSVLNKTLGPAPQCSAQAVAQHLLEAFTVAVRKHGEFGKKGRLKWSSLTKIGASPEMAEGALLAGQLQLVDVEALGHHEKLAFFINVFNALVLHGHVRYISRLNPTFIQSHVPNSLVCLHEQTKALLQLKLDRVESLLPRYQICSRWTCVVTSGHRALHSKSLVLSTVKVPCSAIW